jgi:uncharacterized repeat protein (TIGR01451 family)
MMLKLHKSYNLLFLLTAILLLGSTSLYAQQGNASNFSIYGDVYSGVPTQSAFSDDWFQGWITVPATGALVKGGGNGMIDESQTTKFRDSTLAKKNNAFIARSPYNQYKELNGFLLYDAVYGRDHVDFGSGTGGRDKSAFKGSSGKYVDNPMEKWDLGTDEIVGGSVDLVDVYAHLRRQGVAITDNMWLMLGASTFDNTGEHYVDFELYASPIALSADKKKFVNSGPENKGGHTEWTFDAAGNVTASGDMLAGFKFYNNFVDNVELKIWVSRTTAANINPKNFNFVPGSYHEGSKAYGYITISMSSADVKSSGVQLSGVPGPPWGTFRNRPGDPYVANYGYGYFAEVGINLSSLGIDPSLATGNPCDAPFTKLLVKSKSSNSLSATLKDFAGPYNFLGSSVVDTRIAKSQSKFSCSVNAIDLSPLNPQTGSFYYWETVDGLFADGSKFVAGVNATAVRPGTYILAAAPLEGCTESTDQIRIFAEPCAYDDTDEVIENNGSITINVLENDVDQDDENFIDTKGNMDPTSVKNASLKKPDNGTVFINLSTGAMTYTPNPDFYGVDTFEYQVFDLTPKGSPHHGPYSDIGMVTVNVLRDTDGDKVPDRDDLDDDNDGIPDTIEGQCTPIDNPNLIKDGDFEDIDVLWLEANTTDLASSKGVWKGDASHIPNWESADNPGANHLELWQNGNENIDWDTGFGAYSGIQFVEVDASSPLGLYQDVPTTPGTILRWSFAHRNRYSSADDIIDVLLGTPGAAVLQNSFTSAPNYTWKENFGYYTVPDGQTTTRIWFRANIGSNFIDKVQLFQIDPCTDIDSDGIPNSLDLDSDNDGIPDIREAGLPDADNNGMVDVGPNDFGANGLANNLETAIDNGILNYTVLNSDAATDVDPGFILYDFLDLDSDNDGINDTKEAFSHTTKYHDNDNDGRIDNWFLDADNNGWHDVISAESEFPGPKNSDYDALPDYRDLDSDGDGIPDTLEAYYEVGDADNDGVIGSGIPEDDDGDGLANTNDPDFSGNILNPSGKNKDRDNDGVPNHLDIDSDNDGIVDNTEGQGTFNYKKPVFKDTDGDGIDDAYDISPGGTVSGVAIGYINIDSDTFPDYLDPNTDGDAEWDLVENHFNNGPSGGPSDVPLDKNNNVDGTGGKDGMVDPGSDVGTNADSDGDGLADIFERIDGTTNQNNATNGGQSPITQPDLEFPGNDRDWREIVKNDIDNDGISDLNDLDDDNDGILDTVELAGDNNDIDGDGLQNSFDLDSDGDGIPDHIEADWVNNLDQDGNGMPGTGLLTGTDVNSQGVPLLVTIEYGYHRNGVDPLDTDGDGYFDYLDLDSDNDGISDVLEAGGIDPDGNGIYGSGNGNDLDVDGIHDALDFVSNNDNPDTVANELGISMSGVPLTVSDTDGTHRVLDSDSDGIPNYLDLDSDNDTVPDNIEAQTTLGYVAYAPTDTDEDGIVDSYDINHTGNIVPVDTDGDGIPDYLDLNSDDHIDSPKDGLPDIIEANFTSIPTTGGKTDGAVGTNGLDNAFDGPSGDTYTDPNGIYDNSQFDNFPDNDADVLSGGDVDYRDSTFNDFDKDGIADNIDLDDDNDGILDTVESSNAYPPGESRDPLDDDDTDGIPNYMDADFCAGGTLNSNGICPEFDNDGDGFPNHLDLDSDNDGCSDAVEAGTTTETSPDYQFPFDDPVGTDGIPDVLQSVKGDNSGEVDDNYNAIQTNSPTYDFLDKNVFIACKADLSLVKTVRKSGGSSSDNVNVKIGDVIIYTLTLTNSGPFSVKEAKVKDILPEGLIDISYTSSFGEYDLLTGIWDLTNHTIEPVSPDNVETLEITATIGPKCGSIINKAEIFSSERSDPDSIPNNEL